MPQMTKICGVVGSAKNIEGVIFTGSLYVSYSYNDWVPNDSTCGVGLVSKSIENVIYAPNAISFSNVRFAAYMDAITMSQCSIIDITELIDRYLLDNP